MAKKQKTTEQQLDTENLAVAVIDSINSKFKDIPDRAAHFLTDPDVLSDVKEWVSTGSSMLDLAISNKKHGGFPIGRITEITGWEASGKSLLAAHVLASTQRKGGLAVYFDTESAVSEEFLSAIGVDTSKLLYVNLECLEDIFESIETIIEKIRRSDKDRLVTIVVDSIMGATTKTEIEANYDKDGWATSKAIILSKAMRKITGLIAKQRICLILTNQLRTKLGVTFGDSATTSGGRAIGFHSSVRLRLKSVGQIKGAINDIDTPIGIRTNVQVIKNRLGPPLRTISYDIYFNSGIDDFGSWLSVLKDMGLLKQAGAWYSYNVVDADTGELVEKKFQSKDFKKLVLETPGLYEQMYDKICEGFIMKYKINEDFGVGDIVIDGDFESEEA